MAALALGIAVVIGLVILVAVRLARVEYRLAALQGTVAALVPADTPTEAEAPREETAWHTATWCINRAAQRKAARYDTAQCSTKK